MGLQQDFVQQLSVHIGQSEIAALIAPGQLFVVQAQQVQHGGLQVVDVYGSFGDVHAEVIGGTQ